MNWNLIKLLFSLGLILLLILAFEWWLAGTTDQKGYEGSEGVKNADSQPALPKIKLSGTTAEMYADMVERPLFIEGRRPVEEDSEEEQTQELDTVDDLELSGIYTVDKRTMALFSKKGRDKGYLKKAQGDDIGDWVLEKINADSVELEKDGNRQKLPLRKPKLKPPPSPTQRPTPVPAPPRSAPLPARTTPLQNITLKKNNDGQ